jgi:hypothetical protein
MSVGDGQEAQILGCAKRSPTCSEAFPCLGNTEILGQKESTDADSMASNVICSANTQELA